MPINIKWDSTGFAKASYVGDSAHVIVLNK
jgi:hypothetical protein